MRVLLLLSPCIHTHEAKIKLATERKRKRKKVGSWSCYIWSSWAAIRSGAGGLGGSIWILWEEMFISSLIFGPYTTLTWFCRVGMKWWSNLSHKPVLKQMKRKTQAIIDIQAMAARVEEKTFVISMPKQCNYAHLCSQVYLVYSILHSC